MNTETNTDRTELAPELKETLNSRIQLGNPTPGPTIIMKGPALMYTFEQMRDLTNAAADATRVDFEHHAIGLQFESETVAGLHLDILQGSGMLVNLRGNRLVIADNAEVLPT